MFKKLTVAILAVAIAFVISISAFASTSYETYTYTYSGKVQISPSTYTVKNKISDFNEIGNLKDPQHILFDSKRQNLIITDTGNDRIVILDTDFKVVKVISSYIADGKEKKFNSPHGVFLTDDMYLYIADTKSGNIVVLDKNYNFVYEVKPLTSDVLPENFIYQPKNVAVDEAKNIYVVSKNSNMGVITLDPNGDFKGFIGAQKVSTNALDLLWQKFMTDEQLARTESYIPVEFSNITIDEKGFLYVSCSDIDRYDLYNAVWSRSQDSSYAAVKKINPSGTDVLKRNGFFPPVGDVLFDAYDGKQSSDPSQISQVILYKSGMYTLVDSSKNQLFTYDSNGNLLFAFGGTGDFEGLYHSLVSATYNNDLLYTLDSFDGSITVLKETNYCKTLNNVIYLQENRKYNEAKKLWSQIVEKNNNFDIAYLGIGRICLEQGKYKDAMKYFKLINNKTYYDKAFKAYRENILSKIGVIVLLTVLLLVGLLIFLFKKISKHNLTAIESQKTGKLKDELLFGFYCSAHPFQGYWMLKNEKRGSVKAASVFWVLTAISSIIGAFGACFVQKQDDVSIVTALSSTVVPMALFVISNMCFTTLMDGKGTFKDIFIAVGYSTVPYIIATVPCTIIGHFLVIDEIQILTLISSIALAWSVLLIFLAMMSVHDYSFGKNLLVTLLTVLGMAFIIFILLIFVNLTGKMISLITGIFQEISYRK